MVQQPVWEKDRGTEAARWAIHQAELVLEGGTGERRAWKPDARRLLRLASLDLASARQKLVRGDWRAAILLAIRAQELAMPPRRPVGKPLR